MRFKKYLSDMKKCPKGEQWCNKSKKCVPIGSGNRDGERKGRFKNEI